MIILRISRAVHEAHVYDSTQLVSIGDSVFDLTCFVRRKTNER